MNQQHIDLLTAFLNTPLSCGDAIFDRFATLPGAIVGRGNAPLQRYVYLPGTREDRVVLVAHIDTVWDKSYKKPFTEDRAVILEDGIFKSNNPNCGIGADDRAGCAILWELRNCGHSILITDGEEHGKHGANFLKESNKTLFKELNKHRYMIEFDWKGTDCCLYNQVDNTKKFKSYIANTLGFREGKSKGGTDLQILCHRVCGVNLGIGYTNWHKCEEQLVLSDWENTLEKVSVFLGKTQPRFPSRPLPKYLRLAKRCVKKAIKIVKK